MVCLKEVSECVAIEVSAHIQAYNFYKNLTSYTKKEH
jgi:hypothetical protein